MRKLISIGAALVLLTTMGVVAAGQTAAGSGDDRQVIKLTAEDAQDADLDLGDSGFSVGDEFVFSDWLFRNGNRVGHDGGACQFTWVSADQSTVRANCVASLQLTGGQITVQGLATFSDQDNPITVAITGGTGAYKTAHGTLTVTTVDNNTEHYRLVVIT